MIVFCFGTRPEVIKLSPLISLFKERGIAFKTVFTGQHKELFEQVKSLIPPVDYDLSIMQKNQSLNHITASISTLLPPILKQENATLVILQGDTTTVAATAFVAFNERVPIGHVEAGLRTYDILNPYPEEANRQLVSRIAHYNWAPTLLAQKNLESEQVKNVILTGNTVIDVCMKYKFPLQYLDKVLITLHRRENFGERMEKLFEQIEWLAKENPHTEFIFPMHPNPNVQQLKPLIPHVKVIDPLPYEDMLRLLSEVKWVISDSGGLQEECAAFKKKILICRATTERMEGVDSGLAKLVDVDILSHIAWLENEVEWQGTNPYGDGRASEKILQSLGY